MDFKSIIAAFCFLIIIITILSVIPYQQEDGSLRTPSDLEVFVAMVLILITGAYLLVFFTKKQWYPI